MLAPSLPLIRDPVIRVPARHNARLQSVIDKVDQDDELYILWQYSNNQSGNMDYSGVLRSCGGPDRTFA